MLFHNCGLIAVSWVFTYVGLDTTSVAGLAVNSLSLLYTSQLVQHQAEHQTQQQRQPNQQPPAQGRYMDLEDSRSRGGSDERWDGTAGIERDDTSSQQREDQNRPRGRDSDRPDGGSGRHRNGGSERAVRERDSQDREQQAEPTRSHRSERGLNGGDNSSQSSHGRSRDGEQEGGTRKRALKEGAAGGRAPAEFDLRSTLDAAKRLKLAQAEEAGKHR